MTEDAPADDYVPARTGPPVGGVPFEPAGDGLPAAISERITGLGPLGADHLFRGAWHDGTPVVVKRMGSASPDIVRVWRLWAGAEHPEIAKLIDYHVPAPDSAGNEAYACEVTEYHAAGSLDRYVAGRPGRRLTPDEARVVLADVSRALHVIHHVLPEKDDGTREMTLAHLDVKPGNILVRRGPHFRVCLTDFGIARLLPKSARAASGSMTPPYAPPEADSQESYLADWWSLGMTLLEMLSGVHPFRIQSTGEWMKRVDIMKSLRKDRIDTVTNIPEAWRDVLDGLLTWEPEDRWRVEEVHAWLTGASLPPINRRVGPAAAARQPFSFGGTEFFQPRELAEAMAARWPDAAALVAGRGLRELITWAGTVSRELSNHLTHATEPERRRPVDRTVSEVLVCLDPLGDPAFRGRRVDLRGLKELAITAMQGSEEAIEVTESLRASQSLRAFSRMQAHRGLEKVEERWQAWHRAADQAVREVGVPLDLVSAYRLMPSYLLRAAADQAFAIILERWSLAATQPSTRSVHWFRSLVDRAVGDDAVAMHAAIVLTSPIAADLGRSASADQPARATPAEAGSAAPPDPLGAARATLAMTGAGAEMARLTTVRRVPPLTRRQLRLALLRALATLVLAGAAVTLTAAGVGGAGSGRQGPLTAGMLVLAAVCLWLALSARRTRWGGLLFAAWAGTTLGLLAGVVAGVLVGGAVNSAAGWPAFWIAWTTVLGLCVAGKAVR